MQQEFYLCFCGKGTKISKYLINHDKEYIAEIKLGILTETLDVEGKIIEEKQVNKEILKEENVKQVLKKFIGKQSQIPPIYSAIKVNGKKLYEYAREGKAVEIKPREIEIYNIELININEKENIITIKAYVSKGTYIRTLCSDISKKLGTIGIMNNLNRTKVGEFEIKEAVTIEEIEKNKDNMEFLNKHIIKIEDIFKQKEKIILSSKELELFLNGVKLDNKAKDNIYRIYDDEKRFIGIGEIKNNKLKRDVIL